MLKLSKKVDYSIILLSHLGVTSEPVSAHEMASHYQLPHPMVANILTDISQNTYILFMSPPKLGNSNVTYTINITNRLCTIAFKR